MSDGGALHEVYQDPIEIGKRRDGIRYSATLEDGMPVTVLAMARDVAREITSVEGFVSAFEHAASVHHESLVPALAWGQLRDGTLHCAYARFDAEPLVPGAVSPEVVARMGAQLARGLIAAHAAGVMHGAIDASRVVVARGRGVMLDELGLFTALRAGGLDDLKAQALLCERGFAAPELLAGRPVPLSDVFSLGATLYVLSTGTPPDGAALSATSAPWAVPPGAQALMDVLQRAIEIRPERRWASAAELAHALAAAVPQRGAELTSRRGCLASVARSAAIFTGIAVALANR